MAVHKLTFDSQTVELNLPDEKHASAMRVAQPGTLPDVRAAVAEALESPLEFPTLRRALTPDDHLAILIHEEMNGLVPALTAVLEHVLSAGVQLASITVLVPPRRPGTSTVWANGLPTELQGFLVEEHQTDAKHLAYLASTQAGRRIYLNRTLVDADQLIILGPARFDCFFGIAAGLAELFPTYSDEPTRQELFHHPHLHTPELAKPPALWAETEAVGWLLGMPFVITLIEGQGSSISAVTAGMAAHVRARSEKLLRDHWQLTLPYQVDLVIGTVSSPCSFADLTQAMLQASRVVRQGGTIALLSHARPELPIGAEVIRQAESAVGGLTQVRHDPRADHLCWWQLATTLEQAKVYLTSSIPNNIAQGLFVSPLESPGDIQDLIDQADKVLIVQDVHRGLPLLARRQ